MIEGGTSPKKSDSERDDRAEGITMGLWTLFVFKRHISNRPLQVATILEYGYSKIPIREEVAMTSKCGLICLDATHSLYKLREHDA